MRREAKYSGEKNNASESHLPSVKLPKGGGAISGIGEKFQANAVTGTGTFSVPLPISPGRSGFSPKLSLNYDSGNGNSPFGLGWNIDLPSITRKTQKGLPTYRDDIESDTFLLSGAEDLVPYLIEKDREWEWDKDEDQTKTFEIYRYRPRIEGLFARIERWVNKENGISYWKTVSKDNVTTIYGKNKDAQIAGPSNETRIFKWLIEKSYDAKGNVIEYKYKREDVNKVPRSLYDKNRLDMGVSFSNCYLKSVKYGNSIPYKDDRFSNQHKWYFQLVFDYGEHSKTNPTPEKYESKWNRRQDPFSNFRAGFEIRTYRLCERVLMFHCFDQLENGLCLVRSMEFQYKQSPITTYLVSITQTGLTSNTAIDPQNGSQ